MNVEFEDFEKSIKEYAKEKGYDINPEFPFEKFKKIIEKYGKPYCPCRPIDMMSEEKREKFLCPCITHERDILKKGACYCGLLVA